MDFGTTISYIQSKINEFHFPYFSCVVKKDGKLVFDYKENKTNNHSDFLLMYSLSKPITTIAFMQLVEKGLVNLNDNVSDYIDNFDSFKIVNSKEKYNSPIKIHHLLTMTSGLDYNFEKKTVLDKLKTNPHASTYEICSLLAKDGVSFEPGSVFQYSLSMDVIAALIEKISGEKFSLYVKKNIFDKLNMFNSTFRQDSSLADIAISEYKPNNDDSLIEARKLYHYFFPTDCYESGGAGLISTVDDYSKFIDSLACETNEIISNRIVDQIDKVYIKNTAFTKETNAYSKSVDEYGYGFGVRVRKTPSYNNIPIGEFGWDGATGSYCLIDRKNHISIIVGLNIQYWPNFLKNFHLELVNCIYNDIKVN